MGYCVIDGFDDVIDDFGCILCVFFIGDVCYMYSVKVG